MFTSAAYYSFLTSFRASQTDLRDSLQSITATMFSRFTLLALAATALALPQSSPNAWQVGQSVKTTSGTVKGHTATWPQDPQLSEYLGIPFAKNPTGDLRFEPPQAFKSDGNINADIWVSTSFCAY